MNMSTVEFHFDLGSPNAYLSHLVIPEIEQRAGVRFQYVPVLLGGVFKATNTRSPMARTGCATWRKRSSPARPALEARV